MSTRADIESLDAKSKRSSKFSDLLWQKWPRKQDWPEKLDLYEAAAYLRVDYKSVWRACIVARTDRKARLSHQRIGSAYRLDRFDLDGFGRVDARRAAA